MRRRLTAWKTWATPSFGWRERRMVRRGCPLSERLRHPDWRVTLIVRTRSGLSGQVAARLARLKGQAHDVRRRLTGQGPRAGVGRSADRPTTCWSLRPLGGTDDEITGIYLPLEKVEPAQFDLPDPASRRLPLVPAAARCRPPGLPVQRRAVPLVRPHSPSSRGPTSSCRC